MDDLIGVKFIDGGRNKEKGLDCWGLTMEVCKRLNMQIPDFTIGAFNYNNIDKTSKNETTSNRWEKVNNPTDNDVPLVVLMRIHPDLITHAGVFIGNRRIIHTMQKTGVVITHIDRLKGFITGYYRYVQSD